MVDELLPAACHVMEQYASNPVEADHGHLKARLRPMRGLKRRRSLVASPCRDSSANTSATRRDLRDQAGTPGFRLLPSRLV